MAHVVAIQLAIMAQMSKVSGCSIGHTQAGYTWLDAQPPAIDSIYSAGWGNTDHAQCPINGDYLMAGTPWLPKLPSTARVDGANVTADCWVEIIGDPAKVLDLYFAVDSEDLYRDYKGTVWIAFWEGADTAWLAQDHGLRTGRMLAPEPDYY